MLQKNRDKTFSGGGGADRVGLSLDPDSPQRCNLGEQVAVLVHSRYCQSLGTWARVALSQRIVARTRGRQRDRQTTDRHDRGISQKGTTEIPRTRRR